jgi:phage-related minor tail protein
MAETIKGIQVKIEGNTKSLGNALKDVNSEIKTTQKNLKKVDELIKLDPTNVTYLAEKEKLLAQSVEQVSQKLQTLKSVQGQVEEQYKNGDIGADAYYDFQKQLVQTEQQYKKLTDTSQTANKQLKENSSETEKNSSKVKENSSETEKNTSKQKENSKAVETLGSALKELSKISLNALTTSIEGIGTALKSISTASIEAITSAVETSTKAFEGYATAITGSLTAIGGYAVSIGKDFTEQMSTVQALAGYTDGSEQSVANMEELEAKAKELGATTSFTATEVGEAFEYMAMAGWGSDGVDKMVASVDSIVNLTSATGAELGTVSDIVTDAMTAFGEEISTENVEHFADVLAKTTTSYVAPMANSLSYSIDDVALALGVMANAGVKGEQAGNALKTSLSRLASPTADMTEVMNRLNISLSDEDGNTLGFADMLEQLRNGLKGVSAELVDADGNLKDYEDLEEELSGNNEQLQLISDASTLFGKNQVASMLALVNTTDEEFESLKASIDDCAGSAEAMAEVKLDNLSGDLTILESATQGVGLAIFDYIETPFREVVQSVSELMSDLNASIEAGLDWTGMMDNITSFREGLVEKFQTAFPEILDAFTGYEMVFNSVIENLVEGAIDVFPQVVGQMLPVATMSFWNLVNNIIDTVTDSAPMLVSSSSNLIVAFMNGLTSASNNIQDSMPVLVEALNTGLNKVLPSVINMGKSILKTIATGIVQTANTIRPQITTVLQKVMYFFRNNTKQFLNVGISIVKELVSGIGSDVNIVVTTISELVGDIVDVFLENLDFFTATGLDIVDAILLGIGEGGLVETAFNLVNGLAENINKNIGVITDVAGDLIITLANGIIESLPSLLQSALEIVLKIATAIMDFLPELIPVAISLLETLTTFIVDNLDMLVDGAVEIVTGLADFIVDNLPMLIECGAEIIIKLLDAISENADTLIDGAIEIIEVLAGYIVDNLPMLTDTANKIMDKIVTFIGEATGDLLEGALKIIGDLIMYLCDIENLAKLANFATTLFNQINSFMSGQRWDDIGTSIVEGILSGFMNYDMSGWMSQSGQEWVDNWVAGFKEIFDINSPSKLMGKEVGSPTAEGIGWGFQREMPNVKELATDEITDLSDTMVQAVDVGNISMSMSSGLTNLTMPNFSEISDLKGYSQSTSSVSNTSNSYSNSYGSLFNGANIYINNDNDIETLAEKLNFYIQSQNMGVGVA